MKLSPQLPFDFSPAENLSLDNFLVSEKNVEMFSVLNKQASEKEQFIYLWGSEGAGKSHLLQAISQQGSSALYLPMRQVMEYGADVFENLHHMDMVCLDDIDCLLGRAEWEESLFSFFNRCRDSQTRLIVSAGQSPRSLEFSLPDLASRMTWGIIYQVHELCDKEKIAALEKKAGEKNIPMSPELLEYIFRRHPRDLQSLIAVLEELDQLSLAEKRRLTIPFVRKVMHW